MPSNDVIKTDTSKEVINEDKAESSSELDALMQTEYENSQTKNNQQQNQEESIDISKITKLLEILGVKISIDKNVNITPEAEKNIYSTLNKITMSNPQIVMALLPIFNTIISLLKLVKKKKFNEVNTILEKTMSSKTGLFLQAISTAFIGHKFDKVSELMSHEEIDSFLEKNKGILNDVKKYQVLVYTIDPRDDSSLIGKFETLLNKYYSEGNDENNKLNSEELQKEIDSLDINKQAMTLDTFTMRLNHLIDENNPETQITKKFNDMIYFASKDTKEGYFYHKAKYLDIQNQRVVTFFLKVIKVSPLKISRRDAHQKIKFALANHAITKQLFSTIVEIGNKGALKK